jgi:hypothetical protein
LSNIENSETRSVLEYAMQLSKSHIEKLKTFFTEEQIPIPQGFSTEVDVNKEAPRLFLQMTFIFFTFKILGKSVWKAIPSTYLILLVWIFVSIIQNV